MAVASPLARDANRFRVGEVSYNGVRFPPALHSTGKFNPVYDDSGRIMKYLKGTLTVECYMFPGCIDAKVSVSGGTGTNIYQLPYYHAADVESLTAGGGDATTETLMTEIRKRLCEPGQQLTFRDQGFGLIDLNKYTGGPQDVDNGPHPREVKWVPLTNKMARVTWEVDFCFSPCADPRTGATPSQIAQFPYEVAISTDEKGLTVRTVTGCYEIAMSRYPTNTVSTDTGSAGRINTPSGNATARGSRPFDLLEIEKTILSYFNLLKQFKRTTQEFRLSNDRKRVDFTIVDSEIASDDAFGPGIADEQVKLSAAGQLSPGAFRRWNVSLNGSIEMMAGYPKSTGYAEIARLFDRYFNQLSTLGDAAKFLRTTTFSEQQVPPSSTERSFPILRNVRYEDDLFGRTLGFSFNWDLFVDPKTLFKATGLFQPIGADNSARNAAWDQWVYSISKVMDTGGYQQLGLNQNDDIVVSLCTPFIGPAPHVNRPPIPVPTEQPKPPGGSFKSKGDEIPNAQSKTTNMYSAYDCRFDITAKHHTMSHVPLFASSPVKDSVGSAPNKALTSGITFPQSSGENPTDYQVINHKIRPTTYILTMSGYAIRLGFPPSVPGVETYGDLPVTKVGEDIIKPMLLGGGIDVTTGKDYSIHGLVWKKQYILPSQPLNNKIKSDGHSPIYV